MAELPPPTDAFPLQLPLRNREEIQYAIDMLKYLWVNYTKKGVELVWTADLKIEPQSKKQRGGVFFWFDDIAQQTGCTPEAAHVFCMSEFFSPHEVILPNGEIVLERRSLSDLNKKETNLLMTQMEAWAAEHEIVLRVLKKQ